MRARLELRAESSDRVDDNPDTVLRRFQTFQENNAPVIAYLQNRRPVYHVSKITRLFFVSNVNNGTRLTAVGQLMKCIVQCAA